MEMKVTRLRGEPFLNVYFCIHTHKHQILDQLAKETKISVPNIVSFNFGACIFYEM
jgi:hypothetical protein